MRPADARWQAQVCRSPDTRPGDVDTLNVVEAGGGRSPSGSVTVNPGGTNLTGKWVGHQGSVRAYPGGCKEEGTDKRK
jgi:hypothetical protein